MDAGFELQHDHLIKVGTYNVCITLQDCTKENLGKTCENNLPNRNLSICIPSSEYIDKVNGKIMFLSFLDKV